MNAPTLSFKCIEVRQPIGTFYIAAISSRDLCKITYSDVRRIERHQRLVEIVSGLERQLSKKRVKELERYVGTVDATFPTGVIIAIGSGDAHFDPESSTMTVSAEGEVAKIIDGQHRIAGLENYGGDDFYVNTTIFVDMDPEDQAIVFSTINLKQTPVSKSLVYDLFAMARSRSPQKSCHSIARLMNREEGSPFRGRIMILGQATDPGETLTQAGFVEPLLRMISTDPMADRDALKRDKLLQKISPAEIRPTKLIFRNLFIEERDAEIMQCLWDYFSAVAERWPVAWTEKARGHILNRTTGYRALMRFLPLVYLTLGYDQAFPRAEFASVFRLSKLRDEEFTTDNFKPGTSGESALLRRLMHDTGINEGAPWRGTAAGS